MNYGTIIFRYRVVPVQWQTILSNYNLITRYRDFNLIKLFHHKYFSSNFTLLSTSFNIYIPVKPDTLYVFPIYKGILVIFKIFDALYLF